MVSRSGSVAEFIGFNILEKGGNPETLGQTTAMAITWIRHTSIVDRPIDHANEDPAERRLNRQQAGACRSVILEADIVQPDAIDLDGTCPGSISADSLAKRRQLRQGIAAASI